MRLLLMGPPGSGKGTQAAHLSTLLDIPAISTGDIFRANVAGGTELGQAARRYLDAGEYVPDDVTNAMVRDRLGRADCERGFVLDGYPRTLDQVAELDRILDDHGTAVRAVIELEVDEEALLDRLLRRSRLEGRADDTASVIVRRQQVYREQTEPLIETYRRRGIHRAVAGEGTVHDVGGRVAAAVSDVLHTAAGRVEDGDG